MSEILSIEANQAAYLAFLKSKIPQAEMAGFEPPSASHPSLYPHQRDICEWACRGGRRAVFANFGLGKSRMDIQLGIWITEQTGGRYLIVAPLGVRQEFTLSDGPAMDVEIQYVRTSAEVLAATSKILITNYERVRDGDIDLSLFAGASLDEASVLRSFGSKTYQEFLTKFRAVPYRFVFTATPSPNRYKELIHYGGFLGIMDTGEALTRFFQRDSGQAGNLTLYPHMEQQFWMWLHSWATFIQKPSDLGYDDTGYDLPPMEVHWHCIPTDHRKAWGQVDSWGQAQLLRDDAQGLKAAAGMKRESIESRIDKLIEIINHERQARIPEALLRREQRAASDFATSAEQGLLRGEQGERAGTCIGLDKEESRAREGVAKSVSAKAPGKGHRAERAMVFEESQQGRRNQSQEQAQALRPDDGGIQSDVGESGREVRHLQSNAGTGSCGPLPHHGESEGHPVQHVQCRTGAVRRLPNTTHDGSGLPDQIIVWCDLNDEQRGIERALTREGLSFTSLDGSIDVDTREQMIQEWKRKETSVFLSKPMMYGAGINLQQCHTMIYIGVGYKFADFIQGIHRVQRFQQKHPVHIHIIYLDSEQSIKDELQAKWRRHEELMARMTEILRKHRLSTQTNMELIRTLGCERAEVRGDRFAVIRNDCVLELQQARADSVDLICTSIPFGNQYEYSPSFNDFGHNRGDAEFFEQMGFLCPELLRVLKPGRIAAIHVKDRILFGNVTGHGCPTVNPFSDKTTAAFTAAGFVFMARITVDTDVVRENAQTYRLGWSENAKDSSKMGAGMPEYVLIFRKLPSDLSNAYADEPVKKSKAEYTRADWQLDAAGLWRDSGNRLLDPGVLMSMNMEEIKAWWIRYCLAGGYSHGEHVELAKALEGRGKLPSSFMLFPAVSRNADIWTDIARMRTLNTEQSRRAEEKHVCPLQFGIIDRILTRYSNPDEVVMDPFNGIGSVTFRALKAGRKALGIELNEEYWRYSIGYCEAAEAELKVPTLFDLWKDVGNECREEVA